MIILKIDLSPKQPLWELQFSNPEKGPKCEENDPPLPEGWLRACITGCAVAPALLTATSQVNGRWQILTTHRIETHEPTATKFRTIDYVRGRKP